jgi:hypothetical protein
VLTHQTSPILADTDGDGMNDKTETLNGTHPLIADANADPDTDGLVNSAEISATTKPTVADTDGDGLNDGQEVLVHLSHPKVADTDGTASPMAWRSICMARLPSWQTPIPMVCPTGGKWPTT